LQLGRNEQTCIYCVKKKKKTNSYNNNKDNNNDDDNADVDDNIDIKLTSNIRKTPRNLNHFHVLNIV
jgi:hypothetical protein